MKRALFIALLCSACTGPRGQFEKPKPRPSTLEQRPAPAITYKEPQYSNPYRHKPAPVSVAPRKITDEPKLLPCDGACPRMCDPEIMPRPRFCQYHEEPKK